MSARADVAALPALPWDRTLGQQGMVMFIATEAMLFVVLFFGYFYLGGHQIRWPMDPPPKLTLALIMLLVLLSSSVVLYGAERLVAQHRAAGARLLVAVTVALGCVFLALQFFEFRNHLRELKPTSDAYGSIFYTITSVHGAHVALGVLILAYSAFLPLEPVGDPPHKPLRTAALYWHFVDAAWIVIVVILYALPHAGGGAGT